MVTPKLIKHEKNLHKPNAEKLHHFKPHSDLYLSQSLIAVTGAVKIFGIPKCQIREKPCQRSIFPLARGSLSLLLITFGVTGEKVQFEAIIG